MKSLALLSGLFLLSWTSVYCVRFNCTYAIDDLWIVGVVYQCFAKVTINNGDRSLADVTGDHHVGKTSNDVGALYLIETYCPFIPEDIDKYFPNLLLLGFTSTGLKIITSNDLRQFPNMKYFGVANNPIEIFDGNVFDNNAELERIYFPNNKLKHVDFNVLDNLKKLKWAHFLGNTCVNFDANSPTEIAHLKSQLAFNCPSLQTFQLIEREILNGKDFEKSIDTQIANRTNQIVLNVFRLEQELIVKDDRINQLKQQTDSMQNQLIQAKNQIEDILNTLKELQQN